MADGFSAGVAELEAVWKGFFQGDQLDVDGELLLQPLRPAITKSTIAQRAHEIRIVGYLLKTDGMAFLKPKPNNGRRPPCQLIENIENKILFLED